MTNQEQISTTKRLKFYNHYADKIRVLEECKKVLNEAYQRCVEDYNSDAYEETREQLTLDEYLETQNMILSNFIGKTHQSAIFSGDGVQILIEAFDKMEDCYKAKMEAL